VGVAPLRQLPDPRQRIRSWRQLCDQLLDLPLRAVGRALQHRVAVGHGEVRRQSRDRAQVQPAVGEHREQHRVLARGPGRGDPVARVDLADVRDEQALSRVAGAVVVDGMSCERVRSCPRAAVRFWRISGCDTLAG
jgi:hypothetical protein